MSHKVEIVDGKLSMIIEGNIKVTSWSGGGRIEGLSPDEVRAFVADVTAAIESLAPVKIDRWLTVADIERHGDRWEWHSDQWAVANEWTFTARSTVVGVVMMRNGANYYSAGFDPSDYFTPAKGEK